MNRFFSKFPWLRPLGCGLLVCALVLSICLPLLGMRAAEPDNPILQAEPQEITVLQAGNAPGHSGSGDGLNASGSGANGDTESDLTGEAEQPDPLAVLAEYHDRYPLRDGMNRGEFLQRWNGTPALLEELVEQKLIKLRGPVAALPSFRPKYSPELAKFGTKSRCTTDGPGWSRKKTSA